MQHLITTPRVDYLFTTCASLFASRACIYQTCEKYSNLPGSGYTLIKPNRSASQFSVNNKNNRYTNKHLSNKARRSVKDVIGLLVASSAYKKLYDPEIKKHIKFKCNLITLTLTSAQSHSDSWIIKNCLEKFLRQWRDKCPGLLYFWKAEKQDNNNIHFHVTSNKYYSAFALRRNWNKILFQAGYLEPEKIKEANSTDVHAIQNEEKLAAYLSSYLSKKDLYKSNLKRYHAIFKKQLKSLESDSFTLPRNYFSSLKAPVTSRLWDCSKLLKKRRLIIKGIDSSISQSLFEIASKDKNLIRTEHVTMFSASPSQYWLFPVLRRLWYSFISDLRKADSLSIGIVDLIP